jgi:hypothetical protein
VRLRAVPYEAKSGWSSKASVGVERQRGRGLKPRRGRRDAPGKVLKGRRSPRRRGRMGTSVKENARLPARETRAAQVVALAHDALEPRPEDRRDATRAARDAVVRVRVGGGGGVHPSKTARTRRFRFPSFHLPPRRATQRTRRRLVDARLRVVPYKAMAGWSSKASDGVERRRGRGLKAARGGRRETTAKVLKDRRSPRRRGRMGTSV